MEFFSYRNFLEFTELLSFCYPELSTEFLS